jgi:hypothetical protein
MARDNRIDPLIESNPTYPRIFEDGAVEDGVKISFDKSQLFLDSWENATSADEASSKINEELTVYLSADSNTKSGEKGFYLLALREPEYVKEPIPVKHINLFVRVVD